MSERDPRFAPRERDSPAEPAGAADAAEVPGDYSDTPVVMPVVPVYDPRAERIVWLITAVIDVLLAMRFIFELLGASIQSAFVALLYAITLPVVGPFLGIFGMPKSQQGYTFEPGALVAIIVYTLIGWVIVAAIRIRHSRRRPSP